MKTKTLADFQICIIIPLTKWSEDNLISFEKMSNKGPLHNIIYLFLPLTLKLH